MPRIMYSRHQLLGCKGDKMPIIDRQSNIFLGQIDIFFKIFIIIHKKHFILSRNTNFITNTNHKKYRFIYKNTQKLHFIKFRNNFEFFLHIFYLI